MNILITAFSIISINDFGAIPNDNKDDTSAIEKALKVNGHITMSKGIYNVNEIVRLNADTVIDGNGSTFKSKLERVNDGRISKNILTLKANKIVIKNLLLDGSYQDGNAKVGTNVSSLLHIYDSENILLDGVDTINHVSNWWGEGFNYSHLDANHKKDMYTVIYIGFSKKINIQNMEQRGNIKTEGLLIYESDDITINEFKSLHSPKIWTSLNIVASDNISLINIEASDGVRNQGGSSINFIANHNFTVRNTKTTTKQGFDISNEINVTHAKGRVARDTSYGIFEDCHFEGQRGLYGYPTINKHEDLTFKNTKFIPTKEGYATWGARIQKAGTVKFENCTFGSEKYKTFGIIMGNSDDITIENSKFINNNMGVYIYDERFGKITLSNNEFSGDEYYPLRFAGTKGKLNKLYLSNNRTTGKLIADKFYTIHGDFSIDRVIK
ncbi:MAG TPA: right-handed parallel beta-helix repeat-containing protein [Arcobacter sp.]|nr:right-handed parallel beta-helix repeat-containing protein [Arcobacter sp.]